MGYMDSHYPADWLGPGPAWEAALSEDMRHERVSSVRSWDEPKVGLAAVPGSTEAQCSESQVEDGDDGTGSEDEGSADDDPDPPTVREGAAVPFAPILVLQWPVQAPPDSRLSAFTVAAGAALVAQLGLQYHLAVILWLKDFLENLWRFVL